MFRTKEKKHLGVCFIIVCQLAPLNFTEDSPNVCFITHRFKLQPVSVICVPWYHWKALDLLHNIKLISDWLDSISDRTIGSNVSRGMLSSLVGFCHKNLSRPFSQNECFSIFRCTFLSLCRT